MKYTHKVTLLHDEVAGTCFKCAIDGRTVYVSSFIKPDGTGYGYEDVYEADAWVKNLTPEMWFDDKSRWKVEKINKFKGNK